MFEEVLSIGSNDIREHRQVRCWIELMMMNEIIRIPFQSACPVNARRSRDN